MRRPAWTPHEGCLVQPIFDEVHAAEFIRKLRRVSETIPVPEPSNSGPLTGADGA